jgi:hypothetical protein
VVCHGQALSVDDPRDSILGSLGRRIGKRLFMYLTYLDDSLDDKATDIAMIGGLIIPDARFSLIETHVGLTVEHLIPEGKLHKFEEFHASELYGGHGIFEGIEESERMQAIRDLLSAISALKFSFIYSAVDKKTHSKTAFGGGEAIDIAFRMCLRGIEQHVSEIDSESLCLIIMDETKDSALKHRLRSSFKAMRERSRPPGWIDQMLYHIHDDMYFGDSKDSIGIQLSDLCNYFVARRVKQCPDDSERFFDVIQPIVKCSKVEPEWTHNKGIFLEAGV